MKKLLIIITLFVSSFFLFSLERVEASLIYSFSDYSLVNTDNFLFIKNKADELKEKLNYENYLITYNPSSLYYVFYFNESSLTFTSVYSNGYIYALPFPTTSEYYKFDDSISDFVLVTSNSTSKNYGISNRELIYSTVDIYFKYSSNNGYFNYITPDFKQLYNSSSFDGTKIPLLYDICVDSGNCSPVSNNIHKEELETLESFYSVIIEKLGYLAEAIVSNYIYLSIIAIFILIFVFMLIFRRFL